MKSRLRKNNGLTKQASLFVSLNSFVTKSGDTIEFQARILANRPWFQILHDSQFTTSSYYDGSDFEKAFDFYQELILAFKGVKKAEEVKRLRSSFEQKIERLQKEKDYKTTDDMYGALKQRPLFLGIDVFEH
jgi:hypothetical protein